MINSFRVNTSITILNSYIFVILKAVWSTRSRQLLATMAGPLRHARFVKGSIDAAPFSINHSLAP